MGYYLTSNQRYIDTLDINLDPEEGQLTTDGYSANTYEMGEKRVVCLTLDATAVSSADTLDVTIQTSRDGTTWYSAGAFTQVTSIGSESKIFVVDRYLRAHFDVTGSDVAIDCTLRGEAV